MREQLSRLFKNRGGAVAAGIGAAIIAVVLLLIYLHSYRSSVKSSNQLERVLVAKKLIQGGTSGDLIAKKNLYEVTSVQKDQLQAFAIADPSAIAGRVAAANIFPGQQLTQNDFTTESTASIPYQITGKQRAIAVNVDGTHGLIGQIASGNFVDVYVGVGGSNGSGTLVKLLASNIYVLVAPAAAGGDAVLRIRTQDAASFAFAADNTKVWLVLRPQVGGSPTPPETATLTTLLANQTTGG